LEGVRQVKHAGKQDGEPTFRTSEIGALLERAQCFTKLRIEKTRPKSARLVFERIFGSQDENKGFYETL